MIARVLVRFIAFLIVIAVLVLCGGWAYADLPIAGSYRFSAAVNHHADHMSGCLSFDSLGAVSGTATSSRIHPKARRDVRCNVIISGIYVPSVRGAYLATVTLIPMNFACHSHRMDDELLRFTIVPHRDAHELSLTRTGNKNTFSGKATRHKPRGAAALLACS